MASERVVQTRRFSAPANGAKRGVRLEWEGKKYVSASEIGGGTAARRGVTINYNTERPHRALKQQAPAAGTGHDSTEE